MKEGRSRGGFYVPITLCVSKGRRLLPEGPEQGYLTGSGADLLNI